MRDPFYDTPEWRSFAERIRVRDDRRCTVGRFLGGACHGPLHVNHIRPRREYPELAFDEDNVGTVCARHHPMWEALVRAILTRRLPPCRHNHPYPQGRLECERRRARERGLLAA
jgi:5-methylcytosine-specific restriction endonuclease McrA